jgi:hypothetical protein
MLAKENRRNLKEGRKLEKTSAAATAPVGPPPVKKAAVNKKTTQKVHTVVAGDTIGISASAMACRLTNSAPSIN